MAIPLVPTPTPTPATDPSSPAARNPALEELNYRRFPPFPPAPPGAPVTPVAAFQPQGIRVPVNEDDLDLDPDPDPDAPPARELDSLGIPTVALRVKHSADATDKVRRKKKRRGGGAAPAREPGAQGTWWVEWEELESLRKNVYDRCVLSLL